MVAKRNQKQIKNCCKKRTTNRSQARTCKHEHEHGHRHEHEHEHEHKHKQKHENEHEQEHEREHEHEQERTQTRTKTGTRGTKEQDEFEKKNGRTREIRGGGLAMIRIKKNLTSAP